MKPPLSVHILNRQRYSRISSKACASLAKFFLQHAARLLPKDTPIWHEVTLHLVANAGSAKAHIAVFDDPEPTDVITLAYQADPSSPEGPSGELIVNVQRAFEDAPKHTSPNHPWSPAHELALYIAHGADHLTGADDFEDADFRRMRSRELHWVALAQQQHLLDNLFLPPHLNAPL